MRYPDVTEQEGFTLESVLFGEKKERQGDCMLSIEFLSPKAPCYFAGQLYVINPFFPLQLLRSSREVTIWNGYLHQLG